MKSINLQLEMWANAQRDGRPAKYRWRPLFNAAKFGPLPECRTVRCQDGKPVEIWLPQTNETILAASGPKFTIL